MLELFKKKSRVSGLVGLSLGDQRIDLAQITRSPAGIRLEQCERLSVRNAQQMSENLVRQVAEMKLQGAPCVCVMAPRDYNLYLVEAPSVEPEEMRSAVRWKIKDLMDIPAEDAVIDVFPVPDDAFQGRSSMLYAVAAVKSRVEHLIELCKRAELNLVAIDIPEMAMRNISANFADDRNGLGFLALKTSGSSISLTRNGNLYLARKINTQMGQDVMAAADWENVRDRLVLEIQRSLDYYESQMGQRPITQLLIAPRAKDTVELVKDLNDAMSIKVAIMDYPQELEAADGISTETRRACIMAIGAALRTDQETYGAQ